MAKQANRFWLVKTEPGCYSFQDLERDRKTNWDGVRNFQARNNLGEMRPGDQLLVYHSVGPKEVVGVAEVTRAAFPDPTADDHRWLAVEIKPVRALSRPVPLAAIKGDADLRELPLVTQGRLSVMPVAEPQFRRILDLGEPGVLPPGVLPPGVLPPGVLPPGVLLGRRLPHPNPLPGGEGIYKD